MSLFGLSGCLFNRHDPLRRGVIWDGRHYVGECRRCGAAIERHGRRDWRKRKHRGEETEGAPTPS